MVNNNFSLSGNREYTVSATTYNAITDEYSWTPILIVGNEQLTIPINSEFVVDFENNKMYIDDTEIDIFDRGNNILDLSTVTVIIMT